jgi:hypothetical protein
MRIASWAAVGVTIAMSACFADESLAGTRENSMVLGAGTLACSQWTARSRISPDGHIMMSWVQGYVSAYNFLYWPSGDITSQTDSAGIAVSLDNYCAVHPSDTLGVATTSLLVDLAARNPPAENPR